jgi:glycosyltransferase involved in cell wall biosynthesis
MAERIPISVVVMTKNEERNVAACLDSLQRFDEVFVVDSGSTDRTRALAQARGANVVDFEWDGGYPKKKQWCLARLPFAHDWVLYVDADERVTPELADEIERTLVAAPAHAAFFVGLDYVFLGKLLRHGHRVFKLALLDRRRARFLDYPDLDAANMWEVEGHYQPAVDGSTAVLHGRLVHEDHDTLFEWFSRHNRYSDWEAVLRAKGALASTGEAQPRARRTLKQAFARVPFKGPVSFFYAYVFRLGFLDGRAGFQFAVARAFYYWQVDLKLRELRGAETGEAPAADREVLA